jgi:hypothetical protein
MHGESAMDRLLHQPSSGPCLTDSASAPISPQQDRLKSIRMAQKNRFARATNREDKDKLGVFMTDESILVEADRREITLVLEQFEEGLVAMRAQKKRVESDKAAMKTSLIDR